MLQMTRRIFACILVSAAAALAGDVDWLFDNALGEDYVSVRQTSMVLPQDYKKAMDYYEKGNYHIAARVLERLRDLSLPDGRLDFVYFALGECYRQLKLRDLAVESFRYVAGKFPSSDKVAPSYFRLLQYAYTEHDTLLSDTICAYFMQRYRTSPLYSPVLYITAKIRYGQEHYDDAIHILSQISPKSSEYLQAQFLTAMCCIQKKDWEKSLLILDYVKKSTQNTEVASEAAILMADMYLNKGQYETALRIYSAVPHSAKRYFYSLVKMARTYLDMGKYEAARDIAKSFIDKNKTNDYFFEMAAILEQAYSKLKDKANAERMESHIYRQLKTARLSFEIYDELSRTSDMARVLQGLLFGAVQIKNDRLAASCKASIDKLSGLSQKYRDLLFDLGVIETRKGIGSIPGFAERRYLDMLKVRDSVLLDSVTVEKMAVDSLAARAELRPIHLQLRFFCAAHRRGSIPPNCATTPLPGKSSLSPKNASGTPKAGSRPTRISRPSSSIGPSTVTRTRRSSSQR